MSRSSLFLPFQYQDFLHHTVHAVSKLLTPVGFHTVHRSGEISPPSNARKYTVCRDTHVQFQLNKRRHTPPVYWQDRVSLIRIRYTKS